MISQQNTWGPCIKYRVHVRIRGFEKLVFRKILRTYFMDDPLLYCFITISLSLENLNFVRKEVMLSWRIFKILDFKMAPSCKRRPVGFLGNFWSRFRIFWMLLEFRLKEDNNCGLYWYLLHFHLPKIWPPNMELSFYQALFSCQYLSYFTFVWEAPILCQIGPQLFLPAAA